MFQIQIYVLNINTSAHLRRSSYYKNEELIINHALPILKINTA